MTNGSGVEAVASVLASDVSYDRRTIQLHWVTAALVLLLWGIAEVIDFFPRGAPKIAIRSVHIVLGLLLAVVVLRRLAWRSRSGRRLPLTNGILAYLARIVHWALYAGLVAVILLGMSNAWARGDSIFSLFSIPKLDASDSQLKPTIENLHKIFANALMILVVLHALAALAHHFILRDGVLRKMMVRRDSR